MMVNSDGSVLKMQRDIQVEELEASVPRFIGKFEDRPEIFPLENEHGTTNRLFFERSLRA